jgi:hypothetical protein
MITNDCLLKSISHENKHTGGVWEQRIYALRNGYGISLINNPSARSYHFAWEAAMLHNGDGSFGGLTYDTPLTNDVEVFFNDAEANEFIAKAHAWADSA